jgi:hypothetical protein
MLVVQEDSKLRPHPIALNGNDRLEEAVLNVLG